jgi:dihydroorotase
VRAVLKAIRRRAAFHSEDEYRLRDRMNLRVEGDPRSHPVWRDARAALMCTQRLVKLAHETEKRVHVLHVTTKDEAVFLAGHKDVASAEATPAHLTLTAPDCYERLGTLAQLNPPVRDKAHQDGLWNGIAQGVIDTIGSDHSPHTREEKAQPYPKTHSGMPGVQTLVPLMLDQVKAGRLSLLRLVDLTSAGPARLFGMAAKGRIAVGYDADITVVDLKRRETITDKWIASRAGWTPYRGVTVNGWPVGTFVRGNKAMWQGELTVPAKGERVKFQETLAR